MINPQVFFQAAVLRMMSYILGSSDVVIGTVTSGRTIPITGIEEIYGPCIASLPLRFDISECSTIEDMLHRIQQANRDMVQHCTLPLRDIGNLCGVRPDTPLFDVLFVWQQSLFSDSSSSQVKIVDQADNLDYKLTLEFQPLGDRIHLRVTYDPSVIPDTQVGHLLHQIDEIVSYLMHDVHQEVTDIGQCFSLQHLSLANPLPKPKTFNHGPAGAVERWALETPEKEALIFGITANGAITVTERLTYSALNVRANKLAHALAEKGVRDDELVCVLMEKSLNLYIIILAVLKLGCGYLPIVPESPPERASRILRDAKVKMCIIDGSVSEGFRTQLPCAIFDLDSLDVSAYSEQDFHTTYDGSRLAYAVFTSGSTGRPKGVLVTQDNLMSNLDYLHGLYPTSESSRLLQACSQAFDVSVFEVFFAWYAGICLCSARADDLFYNFEDAINTFKITHLSLTPTVASLVNPNHVPYVELLVTAGEALTEHVRRQWAGRGLYQGWLCNMSQLSVSNLH
jgi:non-ribosomal peptide synthetase component F